MTQAALKSLPIAEQMLRLKAGVEDDGVLNFVQEFVNLYDAHATAVVRTTDFFNVSSVIQEPSTSKIINLKRVNDLRRINAFFSDINGLLPQNGIFIGCFESYALRRKRLLKKFPTGLNRLYYFLDFLGKRVAPKLPVLRKLYFFLTGGRNRALSETECLGRLYYNGFRVLKTEVYGNLMYFAAQKSGKPEQGIQPSYGPMFKMRRVGKNNKPISVYKLRTMHPYAEYLQAYVYERNNLKEGGKFNADFRVTTAGRFFRKFFLDELPMFINLIRGDLKLVGVRPLSPHYLSLYTPELQAYRAKFKPGLIPPYYVDMPKNLDEIMASEERYLRAHEQNPMSTDVRYFFLAFKNILIQKARSG